MAHLMQQSDVFVVGGGPAGLATALAVQRLGFRVTVADRARPPIDKGCGEGIMPDGLSALQQLGIRLDSSQGALFKGIRFINGDQQVEAAFPNGQGLGIRRTCLHQQLIDAATDAGIQLLWNSRVTALENGCIAVNGEPIHCRWIIGADGQNSWVRKHAGLQVTGKVKVRIGLRQHYRVRPWSEFVEVHWSDLGQMYVTPIASDAVCVALISDRKAGRFEDALRHFPRLADELKHAVTEGAPLGALTASRELSKVHRGSVALVGDAAGSVDAITGEGLAIAFRQASELARALASDDLASYENAVKRSMRLPRTMAALILSMSGRRNFRKRAFTALEAAPHHFERMLAVHTGVLHPTTFGLRGGLSLGWQLLAAKG